MSVIDELVPYLKKLRLSGILQSLELRLKQAREDNLPYEEFLYRLVIDEVERRDGKQLDQSIRRANFEHAKTLEDFDFHFNPNVPKARVIDLATCGFVEHRQNVLLLGPTGVGKSHIAQSLGHRACRLYPVATKRAAARVRRIGHERIDAPVREVAKDVECNPMNDAPRRHPAQHLVHRTFAWPRWREHRRRVTHRRSPPSSTA